MENQRREEKSGYYRAALIGLTIIISFAGLLPMSPAVWNEWAWLGQDIITALFVSGWAISEPFEHTGTKVALFVAVLWRAVIIPLNLLNVGDTYPLFVAGTLGGALVFYMMRSAFMNRYETYISRPTDAHLVLLPIRSWKGVCQSVFLPWRPARYETKAMYFEGNAWVVHKGKFKRVRATLEWAEKQGATVVSYGRPLTSSEISYLNGLVGQRSIEIFRDCNKLMLTSSSKETLQYRT